jgi:hypothetical protein
MASAARALFRGRLGPRVARTRRRRPRPPASRSSRAHSVVITRRSDVRPVDLRAGWSGLGCAACSATETSGGSPCAALFPNATGVRAGQCDRGYPALPCVASWPGYKCRRPPGHGRSLCSCPQAACESGLAFAASSLYKSYACPAAAGTNTENFVLGLNVRRARLRQRRDAHAPLLSHMRPRTSPHRHVARTLTTAARELPQFTTFPALLTQAYCSTTPAPPLLPAWLQLGQGLAAALAAPGPGGARAGNTSLQAAVGGKPYCLIALAAGRLFGSGGGMQCLAADCAFAVGGSSFR